MAFQYDKSWEIFTTILDSKSSARQSWTTFLDWHRQHSPEVYWCKLSDIAIEEDLTHFENWFTALVTASPVPEKVVAIWIGLLKASHGDNYEVPVMYMGGANSYDEEDGEWACDLKYLPDNRYAQPASLRQIDELAKTDKENYVFLDWILPLAYCAFILDEVFRTKIDKRLFLQHTNQLFITIGHDGGDFVNLSPLEC
ncbi:hypothetical protein HNQ91_002404 [Filimonas zeae]|uniref:Uncharacterized protein n=1 Tax=Filimonas zeae TaxID=1737353 RepID=A0A917IVM3_9BACT|nr:hypothetical protein [Filimonas zeae]MDR6339353.1 hypothetical protein [Filimonas zeae]GGH63974.1 hypothetical protein GCM10011379_15500 [Filimonas zeae]